MSSSLSATSIINITLRGAISIHQKNPSQLSLYSQGLRYRQGLSQRFAAGFSTSRHQLYNPQLCLRRPLSKFATKATAYNYKDYKAATPHKFWGETGGDLVVEALEREGVTAVFGNSSCLFLNAALERSKSIQTSIQTFPKDGKALSAAVSYAHLSSTGLPSVCCLDDLSYGCLKEAIASNTPVVIILRSKDISAAMPSKWIYRVSEVQDIHNIVKLAFSLASSGPRPGPVVISIPYTVTAPTRNDERLHYNKFMPIVETILESEKPVLYMEDSGCLSKSSEEVRKFVELTGGIPLASSSNGLSSYLRLEHHLHNNNKNQNQSSLQILGDDCVDYAVRESDLLLAFGVRDDDVLISNIGKENRRRDVIHIIEDDEKQTEEDKKVPCYEKVPRYRKSDPCYKKVYSDVKLALRVMNEILEMNRATSLKNPDLSDWKAELFTTASNMVSDCVKEDNAMHHVTQILNELTKDMKVIISTSGGVEHKESIESVYGWDAAIGAAAVSDPDAIVVHIDGFRRSSGQECRYTKPKDPVTKPKNLPIKVISLDYYKYRDPKDWTKLLEINEIPSACVTERAELRGAIKKMLDTRGSYLLQVVVVPKPVVSDGMDSGRPVIDRILV